MLRFKLALLAATLSAGAVGCTQCDTCDDFPTPCIGGKCGPQAYSPTSGGTYSMADPGQGAPVMLPPGAPQPPAPSAEAATPPPEVRPSAPAATSPDSGPDPLPPSAAAGAISVPPFSTEVTPPAPNSVGSLPSTLH